METSSWWRRMQEALFTTFLVSHSSLLVLLLPRFKSSPRPLISSSLPFLHTLLISTCLVISFPSVPPPLHALVPPPPFPGPSYSLFPPSLPWTPLTSPLITVFCIYFLVTQTFTSAVYCVHWLLSFLSCLVFPNDFCLILQFLVLLVLPPSQTTSLSCIISTLPSNSATFSSFLELPIPGLSPGSVLHVQAALGVSFFRALLLSLFHASPFLCSALLPSRVSYLASLSFWLIYHYDLYLLLFLFPLLYFYFFTIFTSSLFPSSYVPYLFVKFNYWSMFPFLLIFFFPLLCWR